MTGNAINAKSEALELHELSSEQLDAVSGGFYDFGGYASHLPTRAVIGVEQCYGGGGGHERSGPNVSTDHAATHPGRLSALGRMIS